MGGVLAARATRQLHAAASSALRALPGPPRSGRRAGRIAQRCRRARAAPCPRSDKLAGKISPTIRAVEPEACPSLTKGAPGVPGVPRRALCCGEAAPEPGVSAGRLRARQRAAGWTALPVHPAGASTESSASISSPHPPPAGVFEYGFGDAAPPVFRLETVSALLLPLANRRV